jgi:hypothetical protein
MKKASKTKRPISAESIAQLADNGSDVSSYFTNTGKMMPPLGNVGIDLNQNMLKELSEAARKLNVSRQTLNQAIHSERTRPTLSGSEGTEGWLTLTASHPVKSAGGL